MFSFASLFLFFFLFLFFSSFIEHLELEGLSWICYFDFLFIFCDVSFLFLNYSNYL